MQEIEMILLFIISLIGGIGAIIRVLYDNSKNDNRRDDIDDLFRFSTDVERNYAIALWKRLILSFFVGIIVGFGSVSGSIEGISILQHLVASFSIGFVSAYTYRIFWDELAKQFPELAKIAEPLLKE